MGCSWTIGFTFEDAWRYCEEPEHLMWIIIRMRNKPGWLNYQQVVFLCLEILECLIYRMPYLTKENKTQQFDFIETIKSSWPKTKSGRLRTNPTTEYKDKMLARLVPAILSLRSNETHSGFYNWRLEQLILSLRESPGQAAQRLFSCFTSSVKNRRICVGIIKDTLRDAQSYEGYNKWKSSL